MSIAQQALARNAAVEKEAFIERENALESLHTRYVELMLSGSASPEEAAELADVIKRMGRSADDVLADEQRLQRARELMGLNADLEYARRESHEASQALKAEQEASERRLRHLKRKLSETRQYSERCQLAARDLDELAHNHADFFGESDDDVPFLEGSDLDVIAADARRRRVRELLEFRIQRCQEQLAEAADFLECRADDDSKRAGWELFKAELEAELSMLQEQLAAGED